MSAPAITAPRNPIPADQNPPCNTLYVGNLPVNAQEDELRRLFSRMRGYKRLCFRPKPGTGPMCFVEFEDVACATHAMNELYGTPLSNSVKGGIRLSYSKNPLGVRQNTGNSQQNAQAVAAMQQQQQQLQQLRQAQISSLNTGNPNPLALAQQQQLAQMKAAAAMKRMEGSVHLGPNRMPLTNMATSTSLGGIGLNSVQPVPTTASVPERPASSSNGSTGTPVSNGPAVSANPSSAASSPMQEPPSFRWLMEAL
jgi:hypothetical protein